jgi:hypothetical protein
MNRSRIALIAVLAILVIGGVAYGIATQAPTTTTATIGYITVTVWQDQGYTLNTVVSPQLTIEGNATYTAYLKIWLDPDIHAAPEATYRTITFEALNWTYASGAGGRPHTDGRTLYQGSFNVTIGETVEKTLSFRVMQTTPAVIRIHWIQGTYTVRLTTQQPVTNATTMALPMGTVPEE